MTVCPVDDCTEQQKVRGLCPHHLAQWRWNGAHAHLIREAKNYGTAWRPEPLICDCTTPAPTPTDMCAICYRVIVNLVHARRARQASG